MTRPKKIFAIVAALALLAGTGGARAEEQVFACSADADCRLVTSYAPPQGEIPAKTLVRCRHRNAPLEEGDSLREYNDSLAGACVCLAETKTCGLKNR